MVYCTKCGIKNLEVARTCSQCGAVITYRGKESKPPPIRLEQVSRVISMGCLAIGIIIVLAGLIGLLQQANLIPSTIEVWPFAAIIIGVFIIVGAFQGIRYEKKS